MMGRAHEAMMDELGLDESKLKLDSGAPHGYHVVELQTMLLLFVYRS